MATTIWLLQDVGDKVAIKFNHVLSKQNFQPSVDNSSEFSFICPFIYLTNNHQCTSCKSLILAMKRRVLSRDYIIFDIKNICS